jgi:hypothetical protein
LASAYGVLCAHHVAATIKLRITGTEAGFAIVFKQNNGSGGIRIAFHMFWRGRTSRHGEKKGKKKKGPFDPA